MKLFFDGLAEPTNPGCGCWGFVIEDPDGQIVDSACGCIGRARVTNNVAEYSALIFGLERLVAHKTTRIEIFGDSKLVVEQVSGRWQIKNPTLRRAVAKAKQLLENFDAWSIQWVPREENGRADAMSQRAYEHVTGDTVKPRGKR